MPETVASSLDDLRALVDLVADPDAEEPMGLHLFDSDDPGARLARHVERVVFAEAFGNTPELLEAEYGRYEPSSVFLCVLDYRRRLPAGAIRLMLPRPDGSGSKTFDDVEPFWGTSFEELAHRNGVRFPAGATWDIATLAVDPAYRAPAATGLVSTALYQGLFVTALACGVDHHVAILDRRVHLFLQRTMHQPLRELRGAGPLPYLGSPASVVVWMGTADWKRRLLAVDRQLHDLMFEGVGLEHAVRPLTAEVHPRLLAWKAEAAGAAPRTAGRAREATAT